MRNRHTASTNPFLAREIRGRFRDDRALSLILVLATLLALFFTYLYDNIASDAPGVRASGQWIFEQISWLQTLGWLLISPALTSASIAYERERGWFDSMLLSPLSPRAIVVGKWASALLFAAILWIVTAPVLALIFLLGGVTTRQFALISLLHAACAMCGAAIGIATSAWSPRAGTALRTAHGLILIGFAASFYGAFTAGELPFRLAPTGGVSNPFWTWLGRTNPLLRSLEISGNLAFQRTGVCLAFLLAMTLLFLQLAIFYAGRSLEETPFLSRKSPKSGAKTRATHGEIPVVSRLRFANPVLDREVRAKFRMRQPPKLVLVFEILLAILVAIFYARTLYWAWFDPASRELIWWGLCITGLIVTMMAASIMGANGLAREREGGTWEGVRLALLSPGEIVRGKVGASLLTCALFSLPVWPLLLPCIDWSAPWDGSGTSLVSRFDLASCLAIWLATAWSYTLIGLWMGRKATRTAQSSGQTLGLLVAWLLLSPLILGAVGTDFPSFSETIINVSHPLIALISARAANWRIAASYALFHAFFGLLVWAKVQKELAREMGAA